MGAMFNNKLLRTTIISIQLVLVEYEMVIANLALCTSLAIYRLMSNTPLRNNLLLPASLRWKSCDNISLGCSWQIDVLALRLHLRLNNSKRNITCTNEKYSSHRESLKTSKLMTIRCQASS